MRVDLLYGAELVLIIAVPRAADRWQQVGIGREVADNFFRLRNGRSVLLQKVDNKGMVIEVATKALVNPKGNDNYRLEFSGEGPYPELGCLYLIVVEECTTKYRYFILMPGTKGYDEVDGFSNALPSLGRRGAKRKSMTTLTELERVWEGCWIRSGSEVAVL